MEELQRDKVQKTEMINVEMLFVKVFNNWKGKREINRTKGRKTP